MEGKSLIKALMVEFTQNVILDQMILTNSVSLPIWTENISDFYPIFLLHKQFFIYLYELIYMYLFEFICLII